MTFHFLESEQGKRNGAHPSETCAVGAFERTLALTSEELVLARGRVGFYLCDLGRINFLKSGFPSILGIRPICPKSQGNIS